jgi:hypothetical protein
MGKVRTILTHITFKAMNTPGQTDKPHIIINDKEIQIDRSSFDLVGNAAQANMNFDVYAPSASIGASLTIASDGGSSSVEALFSLWSGRYT